MQEDGKLAPHSLLAVLSNPVWRILQVSAVEQELEYNEEGALSAPLLNLSHEKRLFLPVHSNFASVVNMLSINGQHTLQLKMCQQTISILSDLFFSRSKASLLFYLSNS